jgi:hypothetical protein
MNAAVTFMAHFVSHKGKIERNKCQKMMREIIRLGAHLIKMPLNGVKD